MSDPLVEVADDHTAVHGRVRDQPAGTVEVRLVLRPHPAPWGWVMRRTIQRSPGWRSAMLIPDNSLEAG